MAKSNAKQTVVEEQPPKKYDRFIRVVELPLKEGDAFRGYQVEVLKMDGDKVISRKLFGKPNLFEFAYAAAGELVDPRNESVADEA